MQKRRSYLFVLICMTFYACVPRPQIEPLASKKEYATLVAKGIVYMRESDQFFQVKGSVDSNKLNQAEAVFSLAKILRPADPEALDGIGSVHLRRGDIQIAKVLFLQCLELDPKYARAYVHLAYLEEVEGRVATSMELLRTAISINPVDGHALNNLGGMLYDATSEARDRREGKQMLMQAIELGEGRDLILQHNKKIVNK